MDINNSFNGYQGGFVMPDYPGYLLKRGSRGQDVADLQYALITLSSLGVQIPSPGKADGIFGAGTEASVKKFQQLWGLAVDGIVGPATWNAIKSEVDSSGYYS